MTQIIIKFIQFTLAIITSIFITSCSKSINISNSEAISGSKNVISENRSVTEDFDKIVSKSAIDVDLSQGSNSSITVFADDNIVPFIVTKIVDKTLFIEIAENTFISNYEELKVKVTTPNITDLRANSMSEITLLTDISTVSLKLNSSSAAEIKTKNINANNVEINATSSSDIEINNLYTEILKIDSSSASEVNIDNLESERIVINASSSSDVDINGKALFLEANSSSASTINAKKLIVNDVTTKASSSSTIHINPIKNLSAQASSAANIYYYNTVTGLFQIEESSTGKIKLKD